MDQFLKRHNLPKLTQEVDDVKRTISSNDIESTINNFPKQKAPGPKGFNSEFYQTFFFFLKKLYKFYIISLRQRGYALTHSMRPVLL